MECDFDTIDGESTSTSASAAAPEAHPNEIVAYMRSCNVCGKTGDGIKKCAGCETVAYCCRACQKKAWRSGHREICKRIQRERAEEEEEKKRKKEEAAATGRIALIDRHGEDPMRWRINGHDNFQ